MPSHFVGVDFFSTHAPSRRTIIMSFMLILAIEGPSSRRITNYLRQRDGEQLLSRRVAGLAGVVGRPWLAMRRLQDTASWEPRRKTHPRLKLRSSRAT